MREITTILQEGMVDLIVGCTASPFDLPAAFFASQRLQIPFVAYLFDDPIYQWEPGIYRYLARFWEPRWAAGTAAMIVPNEVLAKDVRARNPDANIHIVRNPVSSTGSSLDLDRIVLDWKQVTKPRRLVYTGSVYSAQASSFRNLNSALNHFGGRFELHVYTSQPQSALIANGLDSVHIHHHQHAPQETALRLQREADILFLPLSFDSAIPEAILSSSPAKLGEYLASGRPILVHAPPNAFTTEMLRQAEAGVIVDRSNPQALVAALNTIESDSGLRQRIVENALGLAEEFRVERAREAFFSVISGLVT